MPPIIICIMPIMGIPPDPPDIAPIGIPDIGIPCADGLPVPAGGVGLVCARATIAVSVAATASRPSDFRCMGFPFRSAIPRIVQDGAALLEADQCRAINEPDFVDGRAGSKGGQ